ncbi:MAG TPA: AmmeMemoRadiSam system radical SAM enzyme [Candidatus Sumerlaeia bacterium]|nr:MAG: Benzylsuccinate synthase activating enzyme [candidate division BRC1 bacterium ADurb.Bin183]HRR32225.1 AmmeMemoRadiSam system radical SAM enzyme [Candidatus Sumerlaeia bacterium]HRS00860.1 AmmeMemoRadiSam system radical SAM enzyme [Candidatus Sumerlaeia bacterium]
MKEAMLYEKLENLQVRCHLCQHRCTISEGHYGICAVRQNRGGVLYSLVYAKAIASHIDPIEKKPLFHFQPGSTSFSIATVGCNFHCPFCQNSDISQMPRDMKEIAGQDFPPESVVRAALRRDCQSISYTYTEPTVYFEYAYDTARQAHAAGLKNVFVSNGYMTPETVKTVAPYLDAINVDLKAFDDDVYRKYIGAELPKILQSIEAIYEAGIWLEITTLIVPSVTDTEAQIQGAAEFIASLNPNIPWHVSRYHPSYKFNAPPTPTNILKKAYEIGKAAGLRYIYLGNVWGEGENTYCWKCGALLIARLGFSVSQNRIFNNCCPECGEQIAGRYLSS